MRRQVDPSEALNGFVAAFPLDQLRRRKDARPLNDNVVASLAESIKTVGLINPIRITHFADEETGFVVEDGYEVVAGGHRFAACALLGWTTVPCILTTVDDLHAELAMIDENLCRDELSPADRAKQTARRKAIYLELHPETGHGGDRKSDQVDNLSTRSFAAETAIAIGKDERTVRRDAERGEKIIPEVMEMIRDTKLNTGTYLDKIKRLPPNEQVAAATRDLAWRNKRDREKAKAAKDAQQAENDALRDQHRSALPDAIKQREQAKAEAIAARKLGSEENPSSGDLSLEDRIAELEEAVADLERENAELKAENKLYGEMKVQFEQGGFEKVIADKDEEVRVAQARFYQESADKASWMKSAKYWQAEAKKLGWSNGDFTVDIETGEIANA